MESIIVIPKNIDNYTSVYKRMIRKTRKLWLIISFYKE